MIQLLKGLHIFSQVKDVESVSRTHYRNCSLECFLLCMVAFSTVRQVTDACNARDLISRIQKCSCASYLRALMHMTNSDSMLLLGVRCEWNQPSSFI
ncbi:hypothetical protein SUGI_0436820 [Cryptomeria japonica]|nr:hypothetical protein SUGI_0436820 [Cryptomeria japonica]